MSRNNNNNNNNNKLFFDVDAIGDAILQAAKSNVEFLQKKQEEDSGIANNNNHQNTAAVVNDDGEQQQNAEANEAEEEAATDNSGSSSFLYRLHENSKRLTWCCRDEKAPDHLEEQKDTNNTTNVNSLMRNIFCTKRMKLKLVADGRKNGIRMGMIMMKKICEKNSFPSAIAKMQRKLL